MDFPVIVIDSTTNSVKDSEEEETEYLSPSSKDDYNFLVHNSLQIQTNSNDDGDSGIHGSSEVLGPSPVPSHKLIINNVLTNNRETNLKKTQLSLSASSLLERKRSFTKSFIKQTKNRNYSMDTGRPSSMPKRFSPYKLMIVDESGQPFYVQTVNRDSIKTIISGQSSLPIDKLINEPCPHQNRERIVNNLCQIQMLLIIMKIVLGGSITVFGIFLKGFSSSLEMKDCGYWASSVLLFSGLFSIYFASENMYISNQKAHHIYTILAIIISGSSSIICMMASIYAGVHGNWISFHANDCEFKTETDRQICCYNFPLKHGNQDMFSYKTIENFIRNLTNINTCGCIDSSNRLQRMYIGLTCKYLFSSLKDHFVLICSLMGVGSGCELWFVLYLFKYVCNRRLPRDTEIRRVRSRVLSIVEQKRNDFDIYNKHLPSPLIPVVPIQSWNKS